MPSVAVRRGARGSGRWRSGVGRRGVIAAECRVPLGRRGDAVPLADDQVITCRVDAWIDVFKERHGDGLVERDELTYVPRLHLVVLATLRGCAVRRGPGR